MEYTTSKNETWRRVVEVFRFPVCDAPNKRSRPVAVSEEYWAEDSETSTQHTHPVFKHFELYEGGNNKNCTGRCTHCKVVFKALKAGRARAHLGK